MSLISGLDLYTPQCLLENLYDSKDLLDFSAPDVTPPPPQPAQQSGSLFASLTASVSQRAAQVTGGAGTPPGTPTTRAPDSPDSRRGTAQTVSSATGGDQKVEVRCVEGYGTNLYVGGSDGVVEWWVYDGSAGTSDNRGWRLKHKHALFPRRPISQIVLLPKVQRAFVLSEGTLHPLSLPGLEPLPGHQMPALRGVVGIALNDDELDLGSEGDGVTDMTAVVVRRKGLGIYRVGNRMTAVKVRAFSPWLQTDRQEIPIPAPPRKQALFSTYLCAALPSEDGGLTYSIVDLSDASMTPVLPVSQVGPEDVDFVVNPNVVVIPEENQFLVTSFTGANTIGVFLNGQGDPERGTMEWDEHPISIAIEAGYIIALLRNNTVTVHSLSNLDHPLQTLTLDEGLSVFQLSYSPYGISFRDFIRDQCMTTTRFTLLSGRLTPPNAVTSTTTADSVAIDNGVSPVSTPSNGTPSSPGVSGLIGSELLQPRLSQVNWNTDNDHSANEEPLSGSGLTPPSSPKFSKQTVPPPRTASLLGSGPVGTISKRMPYSSAIAETLLVGRHSVSGLGPTPTVMRLEQLCSAQPKRLDEAMALVDEERRKGRRGEIDADKATHAATLRLLHAYIGCILLLETGFERAGDYFHKAKIDPRLVVRLFPEFRGKLIGTAEDVEVYSGLVPLLKTMGTIDEIITDYMTNSYGGESTPPTEEIRPALYDMAKSMLTEFLRKTRTSRRKGHGSRGIDSRKIDIVIDTTLAKLLAETGETMELLNFIGAPNDVVLAELEPFLAKKKYVLCTVLRSQGKMDRVLELLKEIAEDDNVDELCPDPVSELVQQLENVADPAVLREYVVWLVQRDPARALTLLISKGGKIQFDDSQLVEDIREIDKEAANRYLEYVVVGKRTTDRNLHEAILTWLLDRASELFKDDGIRYHMEELDAEYRLQSESKAYPSFFAEVAPPTPFKTLRLKLMLFLQGSTAIDLDKALARLGQNPDLLFERVVVLGRLGKDREALELLARDLQDPVSAQMYCSTGGEVLPPRIAKVIAQHAPEAIQYINLMDMGRKRKPVSPEAHKSLVLGLLGAYMGTPAGRSGGKTKGDDGRAMANASRLLASQAVHLDSLEVLDMTPDAWPLSAVSTFYARSLRQRMDERARWMVLKSTAAGQNMQVTERYLDAVTKIPPVVQLVAPGTGDESEPLVEKGYLVEAISEKLAGTGAEKEAEGGNAINEKAGDERDVPGAVHSHL